ncbi:hypothetical protein SDC9_157660 [bioreactor metagenome]|uniref:Uncharacterized protein n=1 Tax=bioreactor metagenome TaxID=1076179 RepID=A0A645F7L7_9ZZZZ
MVVDVDGSTRQIVETHQQFHHRRLAGTGRTNERDFLSFFDISGEVLDDQMIRFITELDMLETDIPFHISGRHFDFCFGHCLFFLFQEFEDSFRGSHHPLQLTPHLRDLRQRLGEVAHVL